ncbi:hypothetical protein BKA70DRAFT_1404316 [Coprinopsis sp. MPI-PUGE-AT-0042]|nr:hypothetical protein BKA70DRAFT_1404316 [Coprinopsis sp. MPI-PUGE-AT-0042]
MLIQPQILQARILLPQPGPCRIDAPHVDTYPVLALSIVKDSRLVYPTDASSGLRQPSSHIGNLFLTKSTSLGMIAIGSSSLGAIMPILSRSLLLKLDLHAHGPKAEGTAGEYEGQMDSAWNIGTYVHNIQCFNEIPTARWFVEFFEEHQVKTSHIDLLRVSAYFLRSSSSKVSFAVKETSLKVGKGFTNLKADLFPEGALKVAAQAIFGSNQAPSDGGFTLQPPSPYPRCKPLHCHPSEVTHSPRV